jgi:hypothetical protein
MDHEKAKLAVLAVGLGRGFVVADKYDPATQFVITAAHCLPFIPPCASASTLEDRTYKMLLGPLGRDPTVWGECLFVDPVGDIAVLGSPDREALSEQADEYDALVDGLYALPIAAAPEESRVLLLSLDGRWFQSPVSHSGGPLWLYGADEDIVSFTYRLGYRMRHRHRMQFEWIGRSGASLIICLSGFARTLSLPRRRAEKSHSRSLRQRSSGHLDICPE